MICKNLHRVLHGNIKKKKTQKTNKAKTGDMQCQNLNNHGRICVPRGSNIVRIRILLEKVASQGKE